MSFGTTSLLLNANVHRPILHLAVHCMPDCPSQGPIPLFSLRNPKTHRGQQLASCSTTHPSLTTVLCPQDPWGSLIVSQATYGSLISIWLRVTAFQSPQQDMVREAAGRNVIDSEPLLHRALLVT